MKRAFWTAIFLLGSAAFFSAEEIAGGTGKTDEKAKMSYSFGMVVAMDLIETGLEFNYDAFVQGFRETMEREQTKYTPDEAMETIDAVFKLVQERFIEQRQMEAAVNRIEGTAFLDENRQRPGVNVTPSGLQYEVISEGAGERPGPADRVLVHYHGTTIAGDVFDSSYERGEPLEIPLDRVIPGWSEGLRMMREGGMARLYIPPDLAYGENGAGGLIGPNAVLVFDVEFLAIVRPPEEWDGLPY